MSATPRPWTWDTHDEPTAQHIGMDARVVPASDYATAVYAVNTFDEAKAVLTELVQAMPSAVDIINRQGASFPASIALAAEHAKAVLKKLEGA